jgi:hypothetical protein
MSSGKSKSGAGDTEPPEMLIAGRDNTSDTTASSPQASATLARAIAGRGGSA